VAERLRVPLAELSETTRARLEAVLEPGLPATNPLDAWGTGNDADRIFAACIRALLEDPATAALALNLDLTTEPTPDTSYTGLAIEAAAGTDKPVAVIANLASAVDPAETDTLRAAGVPVLEGTATGLAAMGHLLAYRDFLARRSATLPHRGTRHRRVGVRHARERWRRRLSEAGRPLGELAEAGAPLGGPEPLDEAEGLALLADWGCRWWPLRWRPVWSRRWLRPGGWGGPWRSRRRRPGSFTSRTSAGCCWAWTGRTGWPPPTRTWPRGWGRG
jgi:hypothetical protein